MRGRNACGLVVGYRFFGRQRPGQPGRNIPFLSHLRPIEIVLHPLSGDTHRVGGSLHSKNHSLGANAGKRTIPKALFLWLTS
jgi:hypothetical protein